MQMGTKAKWWMVPLIWGPVVVLCEAKAVQTGLAPHLALPVFLLGLLAWTLTEYLLHRFVFHMKTTSYW
jgi:dihydroceramide fatty acyl 2-hydroxylase